MRNRMCFSDLLVTREIKALDSAWEEFVQDEYRLMFVSEIPTSAIERIEAKRTLYLEERARLKGKFSKREEESEAFSDPLIVDEVNGENGDAVKKARGFIFNEHPEVKEKACDGLEEFLRRTLKEDE